MSSSKTFASAGDLTEKKISFGAVGDRLYGFTAEGDPNSGIIEGDDCCMVIDAQATPQLAHKVVERVRSVTDKPIKYVVLTHYHAVRVLGASAYQASEIIASNLARAMIVERGREDWDSEFVRFPRLFQGHESIPGLTWPTLTFEREMSLWLGRREVRLMHLGAGHTRGDIVAWVPDSGVMFTGDLVEYRSACYCGDAQLREWPGTLARIAAYRPEAIVPGRGDALVGPKMVSAALDGTRAFVETLYGTAERAVARGQSLKETFAAVRGAMDKPFGDYAIYEHCLPFNVSRAYDEASGIAHPRIWTAARDAEMWQLLQG